MTNKGGSIRRTKRNRSGKASVNNDGKAFVKIVTAQAVHGDEVSLEHK